MDKITVLRGDGGEDKTDAEAECRDLDQGKRQQHDGPVQVELCTVRREKFIVDPGAAEHGELHEERDEA